MGVLCITLWLLCISPYASSLSPPPVSLNITFPVNGRGVSGSVLTVTAEVLLTDPDYDVKSFVDDWMDTTTICIGFNVTEFWGRIDTRESEFKKCHKMDTASMKFSGVPYGEHLLKAWLVDGRDLTSGSVLTETEFIHFWTTDAPPSKVAVTDPLSLELIASQESLLGWLRRIERESSEEERRNIQYTNVDFSPPPQPVRSCRSGAKTYDSSKHSGNALERFLLIGVKSSVTSFEYRQSIRNAWANSVDNADVCVFFLIGGLNETAHTRRRAKRINMALRNEQRYYNDLLLSPDLDVTDSYFTLVEKTSKFMKFAISNYKFEVS